MLDIAVLFFALGVFAALVRSDLRLPEALYETLSIFLLLAIGLKGGVELSRQPVAAVLPQVMACTLLSFCIPFALTPALRVIGLNRADSASIAAHYGSVSVVTFAVAQSWLDRAGVQLEQHAPLWVAVMEAPGIVAGILLARIGSGPGRQVRWGELAHDVFLGKSVLLLVGGLLIGAVMGEAGTAMIKPLFFDLFRGVLALFLLELGLVAGARIGSLRRRALPVVVFAIAAPLCLSVAGAFVGTLLELSVGGVTILATLAASASYIAAPTAMRIAVPEADAGLSITAALGISFPFNIIVGIPIYYRIAQSMT